MSPTPLVRNCRGATLLEQAVVLPLWLGIFFVLTDVYYIGSTWMSLQHSTDDALRYAMVGSTLDDTHTDQEKKDDIRDRIVGRMLELEFRSALIRLPAGVDPALVRDDQTATHHTYMNTTINGLSTTDPTAYADVIASKNSIAITSNAPPQNWWISVDAQRTLKSSEGKLSPIAAGVLWVTFGKSQFTLTAHSEGRLEKPIS